MTNEKPAHVQYRFNLCRPRYIIHKQAVRWSLLKGVLERAQVSGHGKFRLCFRELPGTFPKILLIHG
jgi:hypothetical protein